MAHVTVCDQCGQNITGHYYSVSVRTQYTEPWDEDQSYGSVEKDLCDSCYSLWPVKEEVYQDEEEDEEEDQGGQNVQ